MGFIFYSFSYKLSFLKLLNAIIKIGLYRLKFANFELTKMSTNQQQTERKEAFRMHGVIDPGWRPPNLSGGQNY